MIHDGKWRELEPDHTYEELPEWAREGLRRWVEDSELPGHSLTAVLENNLFGAFGHFRENPADLVAICLWVYNAPTSECWGSKEAVAAWAELQFAKAK